jgi:hypothetical protein
MSRIPERPLRTLSSMLDRTDYAAALVLDGWVSH